MLNSVVFIYAECVKKRLFHYYYYKLATVRPDRVRGMSFPISLFSVPLLLNYYDGKYVIAPLIRHEKFIKAELTHLNEFFVQLSLISFALKRQLNDRRQRQLDIWLGKLIAFELKNE